MPNETEIKVSKLKEATDLLFQNKAYESRQILISFANSDEKASSKYFFLVFDIFFVEMS